MLDQDVNILKCFNSLKEPKFVSILNLQYDIDYYYGIVNQILKNKANLNCYISDFNIETKTKITNYLKSFGNIDDKIFFYLMEAADSVLHKYYNSDGTLKY